MSGAGADSIMQDLDSQVEEVRHQAVRRMAEVQDPIPVEQLIKALGDESWRVRKAVTNLMLDRTATEELVRGLVEALAEPDNAGLRNSATEVLIRIGQPALPAVLALCESTDQDVRKFAADILGEIGSRSSVDPLLAKLEDEDENVRGAAAEALGRVGDPACVDRLVGALTSDGLLVQLSCLDALVRMGAQVEPSVIEPLLSVRPLRPLVYRLIGGLRQASEAQALLPALVEGMTGRGRLDLASAALALLAQYRRADRQAQVEIQVAVARAATDELCSRLTGLLEGAEAQEREAAAAVLGWSGRPEVVPDLIRAAADERLRAAVMDAILSIGPKSTPVLGEMLDELGRAEKVLVVELLGSFKQSDSLPWIVELSLSEDREVAQAAQHALGHLGTPEVLPTLLGLLERSSQGLAAGAVSSLILLGERFHSEVMDSVELLLGSEQPGTKRAAAEVVCGVARKADQSKLEMLAGDEDHRVRTVAIRALGRVGGDGIVERLRIVLTDENPEVRAAAAWALGSRPGGQAREALRVALRDPEAWVVAEALAGLGHSGAADAAEDIIPFCSHEDGLVALEAVRALNSLSWEPSSEQALIACRHRDSEVVKEALSGCERWEVATARLALVTALDDPRWDVRMAAVKKVGVLQESVGLQILVERLPKETDQLVRETMEQVLRPGNLFNR